MTKCFTVHLTKEYEFCVPVIADSEEDAVKEARRQIDDHAFDFDDYAVPRIDVFICTAGSDVAPPKEEEFWIAGLEVVFTAAEAQALIDASRRPPECEGQLSFEEES